MKPLSIGVIGCGGIAQMMHLPTLAERPDLFRIAALADVNPTVLAAVASRYHVDACVTDYRELIARSDVDAVLLASSGSHKAAAIAVLEADKHLFSEKPLGIGLGEMEAIAKAARASKGRLMVGYHKRFDPAYARARQAVRAIEELRFGQVTVLHPDDGAFRTHHAILPVKTYVEPSEAESKRRQLEDLSQPPYVALLDEIAGPDASTAERMAAFILYDSLLHDVDAVRGILGEPLEVLHAHVWNEGYAQASLTRFANDVHVGMSWIFLPGVQNYEETLSFVGPRSRVKLVFPSPYLRHHPTPLFVERMEGTDLVSEHRVVSYEEAFRAELHHFRRVVLEGAEPIASLEEAYRDTLWIQAIARAYRGKPVAL